jgi:hypothetical protein
MAEKRHPEPLEEQVRSLFETLADGHRPTVDLVPSAIADARLKTRHRRLTWAISTALTVAAVAVAVTVLSTAAGAPTAGTGAAAAPGAVGPHPYPSPWGTPGRPWVFTTPDPGCLGRWLPWSDRSDARIFGKGTDAQRAVVCTQDIHGIEQITNVTLTPLWETYAHGRQTDFTPDQIATLGSAISPNTHILKPWQYTLTRNELKAYFYISYSTSRTDICTNCTTTMSVALPGPVTGYRLIATALSPSGLPTEDLLETPRHTYLGIGLSPMTGGPFTPPVDITVELLHSQQFITTLDADLRELYGA